MPEHTPAPNFSRSVYGFCMYIFFKTLLIVYLVWAYLPDSVLNYLGIYYYPQKYWAIAVPIQCLVSLFLFAFCIYPGLNLMLTPAIDSINTITDSHSISIDNSIDESTDLNLPMQCVCKDKSRCFLNRQHIKPKIKNQRTIPYAYDLDIRSVSRKLYLKKKNNIL